MSTTSNGSDAELKPSISGELRRLLLEFDKSLGQTGADYVTGKISRRQADSEFEDDIAKILAWHQSKLDTAVAEARLSQLNYDFTIGSMRQDIYDEEIAKLKNQAKDNKE